MLTLPLSDTSDGRCEPLLLPEVDHFLLVDVDGVDVDFWEEKRVLRRMRKGFEDSREWRGEGGIGMGLGWDDRGGQARGCRR